VDQENDFISLRMLDDPQEAG